MANFTPFYIPSRAEGKTWRVHYHKPAGRLGYVAAYEGELNADGIYISSLFAARSLRVNLPGRATLKAITDAGRELLRQLADNGYITADAVDAFTPRLVK